MHLFPDRLETKNENIFNCCGVILDIKREDKLNAKISGNKYRKLKYNIIQAKKEKHHTILTYGGAFSNHIAATAVAAKITGLQSIGVIRGEEIENKILKNPNHNKTLAFAIEQGMKLHFIKREEYSNKEKLEQIRKLKYLFGDFYRIPEGGSNSYAVKGCEEILSTMDKSYDIIACSVGTGGTLSGIINSTKKYQKVIGFSALKNHNHADIKNWTSQANWEIIKENTFGGYAKSTNELIDFINSFYEQKGIKLDPIYTGKMIYKLYQMIKKKRFVNNTKILAIHTGGLQSISSYNKLLKSKNRTQIVFS